MVRGQIAGCESAALTISRAMSFVNVQRPQYVQSFDGAPIWLTDKPLGCQELLSKFNGASAIAEHGICQGPQLD